MKSDDMLEELQKKVEKYRKLTEKALKLIEINGNNSEKENKIASDFLNMAKNYFNDARHFEGKKDLLTALAAYSYAHAWLDAGVRAHLFKAEDDQLFTLP